MKLQVRAALMLMVFTVLPTVTLGATAPDEDNCRKAITSGLDTLRRIEPGGKPRDEEDRKRLLAEMERLVETSRRQGMTECQTWTKLMGKAFNQ
jgi:hypothetical protein